MSISSLDFAVMGFYVLALVGIGIYTSRKVESATDYALAGRQLKFPVLLGTLVGTVIGAGATMGNAGKAYHIGYIVLLASVSYFIGYLILSRLAPRLRAANITSIPDALQHRFGAGMRMIASFVILGGVVLMFGLQLTAFGIVTSTLLGGAGISYETAVIAGLAVIVLYTLAGGLLAVAVTDLLQAIILIVSLGLLLPMVLTSELGGVTAVWEALSQPPVDPDSASDWMFYLSFIPTFIAFVVIEPSIWQRIAAAEKDSDLAPALLLTAGIFLAWSILIVGLGIIAFHLYPDLKSGDAAIPSLIFSHMPVVIKGLCLAAIMAAIMSTADTVLLIAGTTFGMDIVGGLKPHIKDHTLLIISRVSIVAVSLIGLALAFAKIDLFTIGFLTYGLAVSGLFVPIMAALFARNVTSRGALSAAISGILIFSVVHILEFAGLDIPVEPIFAAITVNVVCLYAFSRFDAGGETLPPPLFSPQSNI